MISSSPSSPELKELLGQRCALIRKLASQAMMLKMHLILAAPICYLPARATIMHDDVKGCSTSAVLYMRASNRHCLKPSYDAMHGICLALRCSLQYPQPRDQLLGLIIIIMLPIKP
jgi:predicted nucleic acid binding AN1-type Zn finger protein